MTKYFSILAFLMLFPLQACAVEQWKEGVHYEVVSDKASDKPEVLEFFSFWCPHCYNFEPIVKNLKTKLAEDVKFTKVHVNFMGFAGPEVQEDATLGLLIARNLDREVELNQAIFRYIHVQRSAVTGIDDIRRVFQVNGVAAEEFEKLANSFGIKSQLKKNNKLIADYRKHLRGVPNFIVNGKYQAKFTRDMSPDDIVDLIVWLSNQR